MKRLLVALDGSPRAPQVLATALQLAQLAGARLVLYRAITVNPDLPRDAFAASDVPLEDRLVEAARGEVLRIAERVPRDLIEDVATGFASPWDGICRTARARNVDLIVIGAHGYGGIDRVLGTTAAKVVNHADRSVLVVRAPL